jgi:hypothetical protein
MIIRYTGTTALVVLFLVILIVSYIKSEEVYKKRIIIISVLSFILIFNNIVLRIVGSVIGYSTYYRFFWAIPTVILIAIAIVKVIGKEKMITRKVVLVLLIILTISIGGSGVRAFVEPITLPTNRYHISNEVIEVAHIIRNDSNAQRNVIAAHTMIQIGIRQYDPSFLWGVRRRSIINVDRQGPDAPNLDSPEEIIVRVVQHGQQNLKEIDLFRDALYDREIDYVVSLKRFELDAHMEQVGFVAIGHTESTTVYGRKYE